MRLFRELTNSDLDFTPYLYVKEGAAAAQHLFAVASGLDSMVIGETEITGQVKNAYEAAKAAGLTGKKMNRLFQDACRVVKKIRTDTAIGRGATSVGSVAVELAEKVFDRDLSAKTVMILGAGKMGEACVKHLAKRGAKTVLVANRSVERAEKLAAEFGGRAVRIEDSAAAHDRGGHSGQFDRQPGHRFAARGCGEDFARAPEPAAGAGGHRGAAGH